MTGTPHPSWTPTTILRLLEERAATLQRLADNADTVAELADVDAAAAEIRFLRLELTDPTRQRPITTPADLPPEAPATQIGPAAVEVKHRVVEITYEGGATGPKSAEAWWAECSTCGKRSRLFLVGLVSAPAMDAETERDTHDCNLENHFSTTEQAWAGFWSSIANHGPLDAVSRHIDRAVRAERHQAQNTPALAGGVPEAPIAETKETT